MRTDEEQTQDVLSDRLVATTSTRHLVVNAVVATLVLLAPIEYLLRLPGASTWRSSDTFLLVRNAILIVLIPCAVRLRNGGIPEPILSLPSKAEVAKGVKAASLLLLVVFVWTVPFTLMFAGHRQSRLPAHEVAALQALSNVSSFVLVSAGFASSLAAAVSEEVLFRFCLFALLSRAARRILVSAGCDSRRPSLWIGMVSQGYLFGLSHLLNHCDIAAKELVAAIWLPQTAVGIVLAVLYVRSSLNTCIIAHLVLDAMLSAGEVLLMKTGGRLLTVG